LLKIGRLWRTVRHLKWQQVVGRIKYRLARLKLDTHATPPVRAMQGEWLVPARRGASMTRPGAFHFLGEGGALDEHGWDDPARGKLWRYNQHYFDDLNAVGAEARRSWHIALIDTWIDDNAPTKGSGWEPYPTSLRIVNWIKFSLGGNELSEAARHSLALQAGWLSKRLEWHLLGNHLFANAKALVFAGLFFDGEEADEWFSIGAEILREQLHEQILTDGAQFELSPMYHALALEDVLDLINATRAFGEVTLVASLATRIPGMLDWLLTMSHPDGKIAFFNDAAFGIAPKNSELLDYAKRLGFEAEPPAAPLIYNRPSGYVRMARGDAVLIADLARVGPDYLPGHAHADSLSFELSLQGQRLIVNGGTSLYGADEERLRQRGTAAHSTLVVDGQNSSEVWSGFRVGRRARPVIAEAYEELEAVRAKGAHDGYGHLAGRPVHQREWVLTEHGLDIEDTVQGAGMHRLEAYFHLHPDIFAEIDDDTGSVRLTARARDGFVARFTALGGVIEMMGSSWHPEFGASIATRLIRVSGQCPLPHSLRYSFEWVPT